MSGAADDADQVHGVLITGATGVLGTALVREFAAAGYFVGVHYREDRGAAQALLDEVLADGQSAAPGGALLGGDVTESQIMRESVRVFLREYPQVDVLVNNVGGNHDALFPLVDAASWQSQLDLNLGALFPVTHAFVRARISRRSGSIVNVSSASALRGVAGQTAYSAAKAGVCGFTRALAREVGAYGIRCNAIAPGAIISPSVDELPPARRAHLAQSACLGRFGSADEIAPVAVFLAGEGASFMTGQVVCVDGGL